MMQTLGGTPFLSSYVRMKKEDEYCAICPEKLLNGENVAIPSCGHPIHEHCIRDYHTREKSDRYKMYATPYLCVHCKQPMTRVAGSIEDAKTFKMSHYPSDSLAAIPCVYPDSSSFYRPEDFETDEE